PNFARGSFSPRRIVSFRGEAVVRSTAYGRLVPNADTSELQPCHSITPTRCREIPIFIEHLGNQSWAGYCFCAFDPDPRAIFRCAETPSSWALESARRRHHSELLACGGSSAV